MPIMLAKSTTNLKFIRNNTNIFTSEIKKISSPDNDPPKWANGNFTGLWGLDIWGEWQIPIGWMFGYYKRNTNFSYFYAGFADFEQKNASWFIQGYFFGHFMFGSLGENK
jgi:hypothetical protein